MQNHNNNFFSQWWRSIDQQTIMAIFMLFAFSMILVTSAGPAVANRIGLINEYYFSSRQAFYLASAALIILFFSFLDNRWLKRVGFIGFCLSIIFLVLVKSNGYEVKGARRWVYILGFSMQPSEFVKPFFAIVVGWLLSLKHEDHSFPAFTICTSLYVLCAILIITQPDFGMQFMITAIYGIQLFVAGLPLFWIILSFIAILALVLCSYILLPHVAKRINFFLESDMESNYQASKSILAFEQGGMYGKGPGEGVVKQILPDSHADFIFAVAGEEFGAMICLLIIGIFAFIVIRSLLRVLDEDDKFVQFTTIGLISQFCLQSVINIGVTLNLLPTKGMTLPFISYGGSSTFAIAIAMGIILGLTKKRISLTSYKQQLK